MDLGDGVLALEFHAKMNALGGDQIQMIHAGVRKRPRISWRSWSATTRRISPRAQTYAAPARSAGGQLGRIDLMIRTFQGATQALRTPMRVPIVARRLTLGGGCEMRSTAIASELPPAISGWSRWALG